MARSLVFVFVIPGADCFWSALQGLGYGFGRLLGLSSLVWAPTVLEVA